MRPFYANKYLLSSCCNFPTDLCGNLLHLEKLDIVIAYQKMMPFYSVCAFAKNFHTIIYWLFTGFHFVDIPWHSR